MSKFFCAQRGCIFELADKPAELEADGVTIKTPAEPAKAPELCPTCGHPFVPHGAPASLERRNESYARRVADARRARAASGEPGAAEAADEPAELGAEADTALEELEHRVSAAFSAATPAARTAALEAALASLEAAAPAA